MPAFSIRKGEGSRKVGNSNNTRLPRVVVDKLEGYIDLAFFKLVKDGYGSIKELGDTPVEIIARAVRHSEFIAEYEEEYFALNNVEEE